MRRSSSLSAHACEAQLFPVPGWLPRYFREDNFPNNSALLFLLRGITAGHILFIIAYTGEPPFSSCPNGSAEAKAALQIEYHYHS